MSVRRTDIVQGEPSDKRDPNVVVPSSAYFEKFGPELLKKRLEQMRDLKKKYEGKIGVSFHSVFDGLIDTSNRLREEHQEHGYSAVSRDAELIFWQTAEYLRWLGEHVRVVPTADYDDRSGIADFYLQSSDPANSFEVFIDVAVGEGGKGKLQYKETPFAQPGSQATAYQKDPLRAAAFELDGVRRKATILQTEQDGAFPSFPGYTMDAQGAIELGKWAPAIVLSLSEKEMDAFLKSVYSTENKSLVPGIESGEGLEHAAMRKHILVRIIEGCQRQIKYLNQRHRHSPRYAETEASLRKAQLYFTSLLEEVRKGAKKEAKPVIAPAAAPEIRQKPLQPQAFSPELLSKVAQEAKATASHALSVREKVEEIRVRAGKLTHAIRSAQNAQRKLETAAPLNEETQRSGEFLIKKGLMWRDSPVKDRDHLVQVFSEHTAALRQAVETLSRLEAPSADERKKLAEYQTTLRTANDIVRANLAEYEKAWRTKRDSLLQRISLKARQRADELKGVVVDGLSDPEIFSRMQASHPELLEKIDHAAPGVIDQVRERILAVERKKEHAEDFFSKLIEKITAKTGGIDTYLTIQNELFGHLEKAISGEEEDSEFWNTIEEYVDTKNINSQAMNDLRYKLLDVIAMDQVGAEGEKGGTQSVENYLQIIQRMDYISFLATLHAFAAELNTTELFEKIVPDQAQRRQIISKVTRFIDNHDILEALAGDVLEIAAE